MQPSRVQYPFETGSKHNQAGHAIFVTINETSFFSRKVDYIERIRAVWGDFDQKDTPLPSKFVIEPHTITNTSPGKFHVIWMTQDLPTNVFEGALNHIVTLGGDKGAKGLNRVYAFPVFIIKSSIRRKKASLASRIS
jgi:hypothetical protein